MVSWYAEQPVITAFSFIGFILATVPLTWQLEAWNVGCSLYGVWTGILCLIQFVNHVVWKEDAINRAPTWCDIAIRIAFIGRTGIIAAALVIARRISIIATGSSISSNPRHINKKRMVVTDLAIGLSFPAAQLVICTSSKFNAEFQGIDISILMVEVYFVQGHRFDIFEGIGCVWAVPNTIPVMFLSVGWPIPMGLASAVYCLLTLRAFMRRRRIFNSLLGSNNNLTHDKYLRLMVMCIIEISCTIPLCIYVLVYDTHVLPIYEWKGFADLHWHFDRVDQYPIIQWILLPDVQRSFEVNEWIVIGCAILYFLIFGLTAEARVHYLSAFNALRSLVGLPSTASSQSQRRTGQSSLVFARNQAGSSGQSTVSTSRNDALTRNPNLCNTISRHPGSSSSECQEKWKQGETGTKMPPIRGGEEGEKDVFVVLDLSAEPSRGNESNDTSPRVASYASSHV